MNQSTKFETVTETCNPGYENVFKCGLTKFTILDMGEQLNMQSLLDS